MHGLKVQLVHTSRQVRCPDWGIKTEKVPQLPSKAPFSKRFEEAMVRQEVSGSPWSPRRFLLAKEMNQLCSSRLAFMTSCGDQQWKLLRWFDNDGTNLALWKVARIQGDDEGRITRLCASAEWIVSWIGGYSWILADPKLNTLLAKEIDELSNCGRPHVESVQQLLVLI